VDKIIEKSLRESIRSKRSSSKRTAANLMLFAEKISQAFTVDRKLMICGNGGSAADAQHIAAEFVNRVRCSSALPFRRSRLTNRFFRDHEHRERLLF